MKAAPTPPFPVQARAVVRAVRGAFTDVLTAVGADPQDYQSIGRACGIQKNLAWKISKIVQADDPSDALLQMPGASGIKIFFRSAERAGASPDLVRSARDAVRDYEQLIEVHSGDRATFEMMCAELSPDGKRRRDEQHRKQLFQGGSSVWGVRTRVNLKLGVVGPGAEDGLLDFATVNALIDFQRIRPDVAWVVASRHASNDDGTNMPTAVREAIDTRYAGADQAPLMADFCSQPLPELRRITDAFGTSFQLVEGPVGKRGAITCTVGAIHRALPYYRSEANKLGEHTALSDIPAELLIVDLFIHESFDFAMNPEVVLYDNLRAGVPGAKTARNRLPLGEPLQHLGQGPQAPPTPEVPRYAQMLDAVHARMGWNPADFHGLRIKVAYPAYPASLVLRYPLPERP